MENARRSFHRSEAETRYIAYFQAFSNTYAPVGRLKELYDTALAGEGVMGLMIGTRPDCLGDDVLDLVASYARPGFELWLEVGMQTMHEASLAFCAAAIRTGRPRCRGPGRGARHTRMRAHHPRHSGRIMG